MIFREYIGSDYPVLERMLLRETVSIDEIGIKKKGRRTITMLNNRQKIIGFFTIVLVKIPLLIHFVIDKSNRNGLNIFGYRLLENLVNYVIKHGCTSILINMSNNRKATCNIIERYAKNKLFFKTYKYRDIGSKRFYLVEI